MVSVDVKHHIDLLLLMCHGCKAAQHAEFCKSLCTFLALTTGRLLFFSRYISPKSGKGRVGLEGGVGVGGWWGCGGGGCEFCNDKNQLCNETKLAAVSVRSNHKKVQRNAYLFEHGHTVCKFSGKSLLSSHKTTLKQQILYTAQNDEKLKRKTTTTTQKHTHKKYTTRMTASVLKQDPNTKKFKRTLIYFNTDTQYAHFRGNPLYQAT